MNIYYAKESHLNYKHSNSPNTMGIERFEQIDLYNIENIAIED